MKRLFILIPFISVLCLSFVLLKSDTANTLMWWFCIFLLGALFFPLTKKLFSGFFDGGYLFSKTIGIAISAYFVWLFSSLKLLSFSFEVILITVGLLAVLVFFIFKGTDSFVNLFKSEKASMIIVIEESLFLLGLIIWAFLRGLKPELAGNGGLEKFMDYGFVNTLLNTQYMPPMDMWFAGKSINYYYFGHYITAFLTKMSGIKSAVTYNLMMATLFSFSFTLCFSLVANLILFWKKDAFKKAILGALISAMLLSLGGNLHTIVFTAIAPPVKEIVNKIDPNIQIRDSYWFPDATRFIGHNPDTQPPNEDKTIHEFPLYSFVVSDLHAHVINIPFVLTVLALILAFLHNAMEKIKQGEISFNLKFEKQPLPGTSGGSKRNKNIGLLDRIRKYVFSYMRMIYQLDILPHITLIACFIGVFQMTNYWDFPIYTTVACGAFFYLNMKLWAERMEAFKPLSSFGLFALFLCAIFLIATLILRFPLYLAVICALVLYILLILLYMGFRAIIPTVAFGAFVLIVSYIIALPFSLKLTPFTNGIGVTHTHSLFYQLMIIWGYQLSLAVVFVCFILFIESKYLQNKLMKKMKHTKHSKVISSAPGWEGIKRIVSHQPLDFFVVILLLCALGLLIMPEVIYIKDIYVGGYYRSNTMFKLTYQAFMMFAVASGYITIRVFSLKITNVKLFLLRSFVVLMILFPMQYSFFFAIPSWYGQGGKIELKNYKGLDGSLYLQTTYPDDYKAAQWLKNNIQGQPVILEANGDSYTDYGRISVETGFPTIHGWWTHEWLWRNDSQVVTDRINEIQTVYESDDVNATLDVIKKYQVQYIVIGKLEKDKFKSLKTEKLKSLGDVVFSLPSIEIIKVHS